MHLIVGAPIKGGLIQHRERQIQLHDFLLQKSTKMVPISEAKVAKKSSVLALFTRNLYYVVLLLKLLSLYAKTTI